MQNLQNIKLSYGKGEVAALADKVNFRDLMDKPGKNTDQVGDSLFPY
ncbi:MAG: hypothetical protein ACE5EE_06655 [Fidelibacterota bacterium]